MREFGHATPDTYEVADQAFCAFCGYGFNRNDPPWNFAVVRDLSPWSRTKSHGGVAHRECVLQADLRARGRHVGEWVWKNGAELIWECSDTCPHAAHDEDESTAEEKVTDLMAALEASVNEAKAARDRKVGAADA